MEAPTVVVKHDDIGVRTCEHSGAELVVPAGVMVGDGVLASFAKFSCTICGWELQAIGSGQTRDELRQATADDVPEARDGNAST